MAKIVGVKITENKEYKREDGTEGSINSVEFRCIVKDLGDGVHGFDVKRYKAKIEDLPQIFNVEHVNNVTEFCKKLLNRDCIIQTSASTFEGKLTERLVDVIFK